MQTENLYQNVVAAMATPNRSEERWEIGLVCSYRGAILQKKGPALSKQTKGIMCEQCSYSVQKQNSNLFVAPFQDSKMYGIET